MQFEKFDLSELDQDDSKLEEMLNDMEQDLVESAADNIKLIELQELADILEAATRIITANHAGMLINTFEHPKYGRATTIQAEGKGALLIKHFI